jgi:hypothetical protein
MVRPTVILVTFLLAACFGTGFNPGDKIQNFFWNLEKQTRKPGETLIDVPDKIRKDYNCDKKQLPFASIEDNEVLPPKIHPGDELNHRFVYVMCPTRDASVVAGNLYRRIYFKGKVLFQDVSKNFEIKPGKWSVDAFITVPLKTEPGVYSLELSFESKLFTLQKSHDLVVVRN